MNKKTIAIFAVSMVLVCALSVFTTLALLTSQTDVVTNTFTSGNVTITLDEAVLDENGDPTETRGKGNAYTFTPNTSMAKDPTIHVGSKSEDCYVGALVEFVNVPAESLGDLISAYGITINENATVLQLVAPSAKSVTIVEDDVDTLVDETKTATLYSAKYLVYFKAVQEADTDLNLFDGIKTPNVNNDALEAITVLEGDADLTNDTTIKITGYAVQANSNDAAAGKPADEQALAALQASFADLT